MESDTIYNNVELCDGDIMPANAARDKTLARGKFTNEVKTVDEIKRIEIIDNYLPSAILDCVHPHVHGNYKSCQSNNHKNHDQLFMTRKAGVGMFKVSNKGYSLKKKITKKGTKNITSRYLCILPIVTKKVTATIKIYKQHQKDFDMIHEQYANNTVRTVNIILKNNAYYAAFTYEAAEVPNLSEKFMAFDPGLRTFMTACDSDGTIREYGKQMVSIASRLAKRIIKYPANNIRELRGINRSKSKIDRRVDDIHRKLAKYLAINYKAIIAPEIGNYLAHDGPDGLYNNLVQRFIRHANFSNRLRNACQLYGSNYLYSNEYNTTKYCSQCKTGRYKIGKSKIYVCPNKCEVIDRDVNAARNILARFLVLYKK